MNEQQRELHEAIAFIAMEIAQDQALYDRVYAHSEENGGLFGVVETVIEWAEIFTARNEGREWDGEFYEELDLFIIEMTKDL